MKDSTFKLPGVKEATDVQTVKANDAVDNSDTSSAFFTISKFDDGSFSYAADPPPTYGDIERRKSAIDLEMGNYSCVRCWGTKRECEPVTKNDLEMLSMYEHKFHQWKKKMAHQLCRRFSLSTRKEIMELSIRMDMERTSG